QCSLRRHATQTQSILPFYSHSFFFSSRRRHTRSKRDWSSDVCSSDLDPLPAEAPSEPAGNGSAARTGEPVPSANPVVTGEAGTRSEERRVGKECRARWAADHEKKKKDTQWYVRVHSRENTRIQRVVPD